MPEVLQKLTAIWVLGPVWWRALALMAREETQAHIVTRCISPMWMSGESIWADVLALSH